MARLFVIHATNAPIAVIIRRGPSAWSHIITWDTKCDTFSHGAWFKGRIYEDRCDISPDGKLFLYFALQGSRSQTDFTHAWTAVSRPPWIQALVLWPQGDTWGGGGRFVDNRTICLRGVSGSPHKDFPLRGLQVVGGDAPVLAKSEVEDTDWCGRDSQRRLIFSRAGQLFRRDGSIDVVVADFENLTPDPQEAPAWAGRPL